MLQAIREVKNRNSNLNLRCRQVYVDDCFSPTHGLYPCNCGTGYSSACTVKCQARSPKIQRYILSRALIYTNQLTHNRLCDRRIISPRRTLLLTMQMYTVFGRQVGSHVVRDTASQHANLTTQNAPCLSPLAIATDCMLSSSQWPPSVPHSR